MSHKRIQELQQTYNLTPHPAGGYYSEQYRSTESTLSHVDGEPRASLSHIYFLLTKGQVSRWHKVLHDEIWNVYEGDPLRILTLNDSGISETLIGASASVERRDYFEVIRGGDFQAAETSGEYTFVGCSVAPGFEFKDFSYIEDEALKSKVASLGKDYMKFI